MSRITRKYLTAKQKISTTNNMPRKIPAEINKCRVKIRRMKLNESKVANNNAEENAIRKATNKQIFDLFKPSKGQFEGRRYSPVVLLVRRSFPLRGISQIVPKTDMKKSATCLAEDSSIPQTVVDQNLDAVEEIFNTDENLNLEKKPVVTNENFRFERFIDSSRQVGSLRKTMKSVGPKLTGRNVGKIPNINMSVKDINQNSAIPTKQDSKLKFQTRRFRQCSSGSNPAEIKKNYQLEQKIQQQEDNANFLKDTSSTSKNSVDQNSNGNGDEKTRRNMKESKVDANSGEIEVEVIANPNVEKTRNKTVRKKSMSPKQIEGQLETRRTRGRRLLLNETGKLKAQSETKKKTDVPKIDTTNTSKESLDQNANDKTVEKGERNSSINSRETEPADTTDSPAQNISTRTRRQIILQEAASAARKKSNMNVLVQLKELKSEVKLTTNRKAFAAAANSQNVTNSVCRSPIGLRTRAGSKSGSVSVSVKSSQLASTEISKNTVNLSGEEAGPSKIVPKTTKYTAADMKDKNQDDIYAFTSDDSSSDNETQNAEKDVIAELVSKGKAVIVPKKRVVRKKRTQTRNIKRGNTKKQAIKKNVKSDPKSAQNTSQSENVIRKNEAMLTDNCRQNVTTSNSVAADETMRYDKIFPCNENGTTTSGIQPPPADKNESLREVKNSRAKTKAELLQYAKSLFQQSTPIMHPQANRPLQRAASRPAETTNPSALGQNLKSISFEQRNITQQQLQKSDGNSSVILTAATEMPFNDLDNTASLLNDSNAENISPISRKDNLAQKKNLSLSIRKMAERIPLKQINILSDIRLPNLNVNNLRSYAIKNSNAKNNISQNLMNIENSRALTRPAENLNMIENSVDLNQIDSIDNSFGFNDDNTENEELLSQPKTTVPTTKMLKTKLKLLKRLKPPKPIRVSTEAVKKIFEVEKKQANIRQMLTSTMIEDERNKPSTSNARSILIDFDSDIEQEDSRDNDDDTIMHLFDDPPTSFDTTKTHNTYTKKQDKKRQNHRSFVLMSLDCISEEENDEEKEPKKASKKKPTKAAQKRNDQEYEELSKFIDKFNEECAEVDSYNLIIDVSDSD